MKKEPSLYPDVRFRMNDARYSRALQKQQIQELLREGIDLLIVSANESEPVTPVIEEVYNRGVPVVFLDRRISSQLFTAYVGGNNVEVGRTAGRHAATLLGQRGRGLEILGAPGNSPAVDRHRGFAAALAAYPGLQLVAQVNSNWELPSVLERLRAHPEVDLIFCPQRPAGAGHLPGVQGVGAGIGGGYDGAGVVVQPVEWAFAAKPD